MAVLRDSSAIWFGLTDRNITGIAVWALALPIPMIGLLPMRSLSPQFAATWAILALVPIVAGTLVGAWLYQE